MCDHYLGDASADVRMISCAFGGGVGGCRQEMCGVLGGGVIALGAMYGRADVSMDDKPLYEMICAFRDAFSAEFGETQCEPIRDAQPEAEKRCLGVVERGTRALVMVIEAHRDGRDA